jgi:hypothetical protein
MGASNMQPKIKLMLDVLVVAGAIGGSSIIALNLGWNFFGYILFLVSSVSAVILMRGTTVPNSVFLVNVFFVIINLVGVVRYV